MKNSFSRRSFLQSGLAGTVVAGLPVIGGGGRAGSRTLRPEVVIGEGDFQYRVDHNWAKLPDRFHWQTTHGVAVDSGNNLYVIHEGRRELKDHPSIFVFGPDGKFLRAFGSEFQGGGHGIEVRNEGSDEFLYVAAYQNVKAYAKLTLTGDIVWYRKAPMESGIYAASEDASTEPNWSRNGFLPTNFAFADDGGFWLADGYGSYAIHRFDANAVWQSSFGGAGEGSGKFNTSHGLWVDRREPDQPRIVVTDRAHDTLQCFSLAGEYLQTIEGFHWPANVDAFGELLLVPELKSGVSLLGKDNQRVALLGAAPERQEQVKDLRGKPDQWRDGEFVHPHDACFDQVGDVFVAEWVATGRITKLARVK
jgi:hypothetical protein